MQTYPQVVPIFKPPVGISQPLAHWYAVFTRSNFEKRVAADFGRRGLHHFVPLIREVHQWKDRRKTVEVPVFPGYVFVQIIDSEQSRLSVLRSNGTVRILGHGSKIEPIPDVEIESIRVVMRSGVPFVAHPFLREGTRVRVRGGALKDLEGVLVRFKNQTRLVVSVQLLAQAVALEIDVDSVEPL